MKKHTRINYILKRGLSLALLFGICIPFSAVSAVEYGGIGGRPAYPRPDNPRTDSIFVHIVEPGNIVEEGVKVINNKNETKTLLVYATDFAPSSGGGFSCKQLKDEQIDVGTWIELEKSEVTLEPATSEVVPFKINVPQSANVGENAGCIVIQEKIEEEEKEKTGGIHLSFRTGLKVLLTVPGDLFKEITLVSFDKKKREDGAILYMAQVENSGNVSTDVDMHIKTSYFFGKEMVSQGGGYTVLRGSVFDLNFELKQPFWGGLYKAQLIGEYDADPNQEVGKSSGEVETFESEVIWFFSPPQRLALLIELGVLAIIILGLLNIIISRKRISWVKREWVAYEVKKSDDIKSIAKDHAVSWKVLAKYNKIMPPYSVEKDMQIIVPPKPKSAEKPKKVKSDKPKKKKSAKSKKESEKTE